MLRRLAVFLLYPGNAIFAYEIILFPFLDTFEPTGRFLVCFNPPLGLVAGVLLLEAAFQAPHPVLLFLTSGINRLKLFPDEHHHRYRHRFVR